MTCSHPYEARETADLVASLPGDREEHRVVRCTACNTVIVPDGVLVQAMPETYPARVYCACGVELTQAYAKERGECLACTQNKMRVGRGPSFYVGYRERIR